MKATVSVAARCCACLLVVSLYGDVLFYEKKIAKVLSTVDHYIVLHSFTTRSSTLSVMPMFLWSISYIEVFSQQNDTWLDAEFNYQQACKISP